MIKSAYASFHEPSRTSGAAGGASRLRVNRSQPSQWYSPAELSAFGESSEPAEPAESVQWAASEVLSEVQSDVGGGGSIDSGECMVCSQDFPYYVLSTGNGNKNETDFFLGGNHIKHIKLVPEGSGFSFYGKGSSLSKFSPPNRRRPNGETAENGTANRFRDKEREKELEEQLSAGKRLGKFGKAESLSHAVLVYVLFHFGGKLETKTIKYETRMHNADFVWIICRNPGNR